MGTLQEEGPFGTWERLGGTYGVWRNQVHGFTTDTLLLAAFSPPKKGEICADFGTGCGAIPVLWHIYGRPKKVYGIELQAEAAAQAQSAAARNGLQESMEIICGDVRDIRQLLPNRRLHCIACNPPYKAIGAGVQNTAAAKRIARHEAALTPAEIAKAAAYLLHFGGRLCICQRPERLTDFLAIFRQHKLEPKRLQFVQKDAASKPSLFLLEARHGGNPGLQVEPALLLTAWQGYNRE